MKRHLLYLIAALAVATPLAAQSDDTTPPAVVVVDDADTDDGQDDSNTDATATTTDFPEEAVAAETDSLLALYMARTYLQADSNCQMGSVNPVYERQEYIDRLQRMPCVIEMPYNDVVQQHIDRYTGRMRRTVSYLLGAANFYMPFFEEALEAMQLPLELKYLPVVESALNPTAVSRAGAAGLWQFMPIAAKQYHLTVNSLVDERRDPVKASQAAAQMLSDLYRLFGDWHLAIAAYNCGPENVNKAIHRAGGERDYWALYPYLPRETRGYVPAFIAANYVMNYYCEHNICPMNVQLPAKTDTVMLTRNVHLAQVAAVMQLDLELLRGLNPELRRDVVPGATAPTALRLPAEETARFIDLQDSIFAYQRDNYMNRRAEVTPADEPAPAVRKRTSKTRNTRATRTTQSRQTKSVTVKSGQTLSEIARRNGTTVKRLQQLNGIRGTSIRSGQKLRVK